ncbi:MAG: thiamine transporter, inner rane subunit [Rhizobium sp.]|nr:thiamine transporter, inner rane subunit [Rhizobium sp.]
MDRDSRIWFVPGAFSLGAILLFVAIAVAMLLLSGGWQDSWPPLSYISRVTLFTIAQALASTILSVVFALPVALAIARRADFPGRSLVLGLMLLPLGLPVLPAVFGIVEIWGRQGLVNDILRLAGVQEVVSIYGLTGILIGHVFFNLPLATRLMVKALDHVPRGDWRLAAGLDFNRLALFRFIEWPALLRVIPGIAGLIFMLCVTSFTIILTLGGGPRTSTLEVAIYQALKFEYDPPRALVLSALQLAITILVFVLLRLFPDPEQDRSAVQGKPFRVDGRSRLSKICDSLWLALFLTFVGAPMIAILVSGLKADLVHLVADPLFLQALVTSVLIAISAGLLAVLLTFFMVRARLAIGERGISALFRLPEFMLLVPPLALGSGWFVLLLRTGIETNAAIPIVVIINMLMAMPFTARVIAPELKTHLLRTGRLADSLDITGLSRLRLVDWPVLHSPLLTALSFAMALSLGDMGAIALFGSENFITLPSLLYAKLGSYRSTDAAGLALILGVICLILMLPAVRSDRRGGETS